MTITDRAGASPLLDPGEQFVLRTGALSRQIGWPRRRAAPLAWVQLLVVTLVVFQRFVVPGTAVSLALPVTFLVLLMLGLSGHLVLDVTRTAWYAAAAGACGLATLVASAWSGLDISVNSVLLLIVTYLPFCARVSPELRRRFPEVLRLFQRLVLVAAVACVVQWAAQMAGWVFEDVLRFLPPTMLASTTEYNLSYPLYYGSSIFKSNGVVFMEPSFASQFLALAIIVHILIRGPRWQLPVLTGALVTTFSGTGIVLLTVGLCVLGVRRGGKWAGRTAGAVAVAVVLVGLTPAGELLADRSMETSAEGSSGNARFIAPYALVTAAVSRDANALLVGRGAGSVARDLDFFNPERVPSNPPAVPKLLGEYGLPAAMLFLCFLFVSFFQGMPSPTLAVLAGVLYFALSSALLQPPIVYTVWLLTALFATGPCIGAHCDGLLFARGAVVAR